MKILLALLLYAFIFLTTVTSFALPDSEVQTLVKSNPVFAESEKLLLETWKQLPAEIKQAQKASQMEWIKVSRDQNAKILMHEGMSFAEAHTITNYQRIKALKDIKAKYEEKSAITLEDFSNMSAKMQSMAMVGYVNGFVFGCEVGAGVGTSREAEENKNHCDFVRGYMLCTSMDKVKNLLLEIAEKDKYKNVDLFDAIHLASFGCSSITGDIEYAQIYKSLDSIANTP